MSIALSTIGVFAAAVARAHSVDLASYTLPTGAVRAALIAAAQTGAGVRVRLERDPFDGGGQLHRANADAIAELRAGGVDAALTGPGEPVLHMKAALVDGVAWLDDRNWAGDGSETVVRDSDPEDVAALGRSLNGAGVTDTGGGTGPGGVTGTNGGTRTGGDTGTGGGTGIGGLRMTKASAQGLELGVVRGAGVAPLAIETESFGNGAIYNALLARGLTGEPTRLLVAGREAADPGPRGETERRRLARLGALGVEVRTGNPAGRDLDEKLAVTPAAAWTGSANATYAHGPAGEQRDWGLTLREAPLVDGLRAAFETNWREARPFAVLALPTRAVGDRDH